MRSFLPLVATLVAVTAASACGWIGSGDAGDDRTSAEPESTLATRDSVVAGPRPAEGEPDSAVAEPQPAQVPELPRADGADASLADRIDLLIAAQAETRRRLDSLTAVLGAAIDASRSSEGVAEPAGAGAGTDGDRAGIGGAEGETPPGEVLEEARDRVRSFGVGVLWSIVVVLLFNYVIHALAWVLDHLSERSPRRRLFFKGLVPIVRIVLWLFAGYLIVRVIFRVDAQGVLAGAAALGVAIGFAAQDLLKNIFGGIILVFDQPFQVGDKIRVGETYGEVTSIGLRSTRIVTPDDNLVSVPNAQVVDQQVANANAGELNCQVVIDLYLPPGVDEGLAKKIAFEAAVGSRYVYLNKPIVVLVREQLSWTVFTRIRVKAYVLDPRHEFLFESDVTERARAGFRAAGLGEGLDLAIAGRPAPVADPGPTADGGAR